MQFFIQHSSAIFVILSLAISFTFFCITMKIIKGKFAKINVHLGFLNSSNEQIYGIVASLTIVVFFFHFIMMDYTKNRLAALSAGDWYYFFVVHAILMSVILMKIWPGIVITIYKTTKSLLEKRKARIIRLASEFNKTHAV